MCGLVCQGEEVDECARYKDTEHINQYYVSVSGLPQAQAGSFLKVQSQCERNMP